MTDILKQIHNKQDRDKRLARAMFERMVEYMFQEEIKEYDKETKKAPLRRAG